MRGSRVDNLDLVGVFAKGGIVEDEVRAGLFFLSVLFRGGIPLARRPGERVRFERTIARSRHLDIECR
jgi:hypothetical protein